MPLDSNQTSKSKHRYPFMFAQVPIELATSRKQKLLLEKASMS